MINEVLADPPSAVGDANCDGLISASQDEMIELVNVGSTPIDLSGSTVRDAVGVRLAFAAGTVLAPGQVMVVFGGGTPSFDGGPQVWCDPLPSNVSVAVAPAGLALANSGDTVRVVGWDGITVLAEMTYGGSVQDQSLVLQPELQAGTYLGHADVYGQPVSPGRFGDGTAIFVPMDTGLTAHTGEPPHTGTPVETGDTGVSPFPIVGDVVINEVLADPPDGFPAGDANCDLTGHPSQDEFVEIVNTGGTIDLTGATLSDASGLVYTFPSLLLGPDEAVVVFGGGVPNFTGSGLSGPWCAALPASVHVLAGNGLNLNNTGDTVTLVASDGMTVLDTLAWGVEGGDDQSLNRDPELDGLAPLVRHRNLAGSVGAFSPGTLATGVGFDEHVIEPTGDTGIEPTGDTGVFVSNLVLNEVLADPESDANCDGTIDNGDEFIEVHNPGPNTLDLSGAQLFDASALRHVFSNGTQLAPGETLVLFGGGTPAFGNLAHPWCRSMPAGVQVATALGSLDLNNGGDTVRITLLDQVFLDTSYLGANQGQSLTRDPELLGAFVQHQTLSADPQSPGRSPDGTPIGRDTPFPTGDTAAGTGDTGLETGSPGDTGIDETGAGTGAGTGDTNDTGIDPVDTDPVDTDPVLTGDTGTGVLPTGDTGVVQQTGGLSETGADTGLGDTGDTDGGGPVDTDPMIPTGDTGSFGASGETGATSTADTGDTDGAAPDPTGDTGAAGVTDTGDTAGTTDTSGQPSGQTGLADTGAETGATDTGAFDSGSTAATGDTGSN